MINDWDIFDGIIVWAGMWGYIIICAIAICVLIGIWETLKFIVRGLYWLVTNINWYLITDPICDLYDATVAKWGESYRKWHKRRHTRGYEAYIQMYGHKKH